MDWLIAAVERLDRLRLPSDLSFARDGRSIAATAQPVARERDESYASRIWRFALVGGAEQLTYGPNGDALPRHSPTDDRLAFVSDRAIKGKADLYLLEGSQPRPLGDVPGTIEAFAWTDDGKGIAVLAADRGLDGSATNGATRLWWGEDDDPAVTNPEPRRRLYKVSTADGATTEVGPLDLSVWAFDLIDADGAVAIVSDDASERGWYHSRLVRIDFATRVATTLHETEWQLLSPAVSPDKKRVAFLNGWSSDRGLVASAIRVLEFASGELTTLDAEDAQDVTTLKWRDDDSLWFAGWSRLGTIYGVIRRDNALLWSSYEDAIIGTNSFSASLTPAPDGAGFAAVRETDGEPPEIVYKPNGAVDWRRVSALNARIAEDFPDYPEIRVVSWRGVGGLLLDGIVMLARDRQPGPLPMIVDIHGGPSWAAKHAFNPGYALPYAAAGYAVFLPNYRGNTGWGQDFAKSNLGDPGGAEFEDILAGIDWCIAENIALPGRIGVTGASYGGYMTAWAVATTHRFAAAVMVSGIANQISSHYSCNHDFHGFINGGPLTDPTNRAIALDRSPITRLDQPTTPTLILHGSEDRCTPLGQAQEFYSALRERGCIAELVVYPREGHGNQERAHSLDAWRRSVTWFDRFLGPES